jgi:micrococcal nuclease
VWLTALRKPLHKGKLMSKTASIFALAIGFALQPVNIVPAKAGGNMPEMAMCKGFFRVSCVVDGDTIWLEGEKIRIRDLDTPEISKADCPEELRLAADATATLIALLNDNDWTVERDGQDRYQRTLARIMINGASVADPMIAAGVAIKWEGKTGKWC